MAYEIIVRKRFTNKVIKLLSYLESEWNMRVAEAFLESLNTRIEGIAINPYLGVNTGLKECRSILITKHNRLYYRIKGDKVEILNIYDTRMNPTKNPFR